MPLEDEFREALYRAGGDPGRDSELPTERRLELALARQRALEELVLELAAQIDQLKRPSGGLGV